MTPSDQDAAHILFPDDAPKAPTAAPDWFRAETATAEARLMGGSNRQAAAKDTRPAAGQDDQSADKLFPTEGKEFDDSVVTGLFDQYALSAIADGDNERAAALKHATSSLIEDFRSAGTSSDELKAAFDVVREANDFITPPAPEKIEADMNANLAILQREVGETFQSDLAAARAFVRDLEIVAPGTIASLEHNGSGNDLRLVRAAIKEARRRNYGTRR